MQKGTPSIVRTVFIDEIVERFHVFSASFSPAAANCRLEGKGESEGQGDWPYREAVGSLMWVSVMSRPDIANSVREVARYSHNPSRSHWNAVRRILKYLKHTRLKGITYKKGEGLNLKVYADSDFARREEDRRSVSGVAVMCAGAAVSWFSRTQRCVTL